MICTLIARGILLQILVYIIYTYVYKKTTTLKCRNGMPKSKQTKPYLCIIFSLEYNCSVKRCRDKDACILFGMPSLNLLILIL